jgi:hypothetical protein
MAAGSNAMTRAFVRRNNGHKQPVRIRSHCSTSFSPLGFANECASCVRRQEECLILMAVGRKGGFLASIGGSSDNSPNEARLIPKETATSFNFVLLVPPMPKQFGNHKLMFSAPAVLVS